MIGHSQQLLDGDRIHMDSPEASYHGRFTIDTTSTPMQIDMQFVEGPEAGNTAYGIFHDNADQ